MNLGLIVALVVVVVIVLIVIAAVKVVREYERAIVFRLGRLLPNPKGPGLFILIPVVDRMVKVDLRTITLNIPPQDVITRDNVPVRVNAVAYFRIVEPKAAVVQVENFMVRDLADRADDAALRARPALARRAALRAREDQRDPPADHRRADLAVGDQGLDRRGEGRRDPAGHAAGDGAAGRGRARAAREGDRRRGRVPGLRAAEGRGDRDRAAPDRAPAALPADADRDQLVGVDDDRLPGADRHHLVAPAADARTSPVRLRRASRPCGELRRPAARGSGARRRSRRRGSGPCPSPA